MIRVKGSPDRAVSVIDVALAAHFKYGRTISGRGMFMKPKSPVDPDTGKMDPDSTEAHACTVAEVEVDTETGEVTVLSLQERLRGRPPGQPGAGQGADRRRRVHGHGARALRDDRALLPGHRPCADRLLRLRAARPGRAAA